MASFSISGRATIVGTSALPLVSLYATAGVRPMVSWISFSNTSATSCVVALNRLTTTGTQGAGLTEVPIDSPDHTAVATGFAGHTVGPTVGGEIARITLPDAKGGGTIWTFSPRLEVGAATTNGIGLLVPTGTGQTLDYMIIWDE